MRNKIKVVFLWFRCAFIAICVLEVCARLDDQIVDGAPFFGKHTVDSIMTRDKLGRRGIPNARYRKWKLNALGYRGPDVRNGTRRLICIGASETFGMAEPENREFPRQLENELNAGDPEARYEVVNVAYPGQTLRSAILRIPQYAQELRPELAIIYASPAMYINLDASVTPKPATEPLIELRLTERVRELAKDLLPESIQTFIRQRNIREHKAGLAAFRGTVTKEIPQANVAAFKADLEQAIQTLRAYGIEPVIVTHATLFGPNFEYKDEEMLVSWRRFYPSLDESGFANMESRMNEAARITAAELRVPVVDAARTVPYGAVYFSDFVHFTDLGANAIARQIAAPVRSEILPRSFRMAQDNGTSRSRTQALAPERPSK
jgi:hypothetical protein